MEGVLASFAQFDNDVRSDRTRAGMKAALELGRWTFLAPIGYINVPRTYGKSLIPDPERAPVVQQIFRDFATGRFTKQELLDEMTRRGLKTRKGLPVSSQAFATMLREPAVRRHRERPWLRRRRQARRLRSSDSRRRVLSRSGDPDRTGAHDWPTPSAVGLSSRFGRSSSVRRADAVSRRVGRRDAALDTRTTTASHPAGR